MATDDAENTPVSTDDLIRQVLAEQQEHRAEVAKLRDELAQQKAAQKAPIAPSANAPSPEDALAARMEEIGQHDFYCPGCGNLVDYQQRCTGKPESPHPPIEVVSTDELKSGDTSQHSEPVYVQ